MTKYRKDKNKPKITDWIQAISAAISIPAAIIAYFTFFHKDENLQRQISSLDTISRQSIIQTNILKKQVEILIEEQDFQKMQNDLSLSNRKTEIEPKLIIEFEYQNGDVVSASLINNGKSAKILKIVEKNPNDFIIDIPFQYIGEGKEKKIFFRYKNASERNEKTVLNFLLFYEDIDRKILSKDFKFTNIEGIISEKNKNSMMMN